MKLFLAPSAGHLLRSLVRYDVPMGRFETFSFADQERGYRLKEEVKGRPVGIVACILPDPRSLFDLMALHRLLCDNGAARIDLILPYLVMHVKTVRIERGKPASA
jgi:phosphoribosylpyrophosphate synthetase